MENSNNKPAPLGWGINLIFLIAILSLLFTAWHALHNVTKKTKSDYQLNITKDTVYLMDGTRMVTKAPLDSIKSFKELIINDNQ